MAVLSARKANVDNLELVSVKTISDHRGVMVIIDGSNDLPCDLKRVFTIVADKGVRRGDHAHKECTQFLLVVRGSIIVTCNDSDSEKIIVLEADGAGLLIPPGIWADQLFVADATVLQVICDQGFDEKDYFRDYEKFIAFKKSKCDGELNCDC